MDERLRSSLVKKYKIAYIGNDLTRCNTLFEKLDQLGKNQLTQWHKHQTTIYNTIHTNHRSKP